tara:strand:- start:1370 stop:1594 length:225 start_codon:yes stop_codon:yes gene_type:complete
MLDEVLRTRTAAQRSGNDPYLGADYEIQVIRNYAKGHAANCPNSLGLNQHQRMLLSLETPFALSSRENHFYYLM